MDINQKEQLSAMLRCKGDITRILYDRYPDMRDQNGQIYFKGYALFSIETSYGEYLEILEGENIFQFLLSFFSINGSIYPQEICLN